MTTQALPAAVSAAPKPGESLAEAFPDLARRWDVAANAPLTPADVSRGSNRMVVWTCDKGHPSFSTRVFLMTRSRAGGCCPVCRNAMRSAPRGNRSLAQEFPEVAGQWDYEANYPVTPDQVAPRSNRKAWFTCPQHGSQLSYISNRTAGHGCPLCGNGAGGKAFQEQAVRRASLAVSHPELAAEWSAELNTLTPGQVSRGSTRHAWWNCPAGHTPYSAAIRSRTKKSGTGCPVCGSIKMVSYLKPYKGPSMGQSLADLRPDIAACWDAELNELTPSDVAPYSHRVVSWTCQAGHSFLKTVSAMSLSTRCPECRPRKKSTSHRNQ